MGGLVALEGRDLIAAFVAGGFRIARHERGLALLVRGVQVVVVPETGLLPSARIRGLLDRSGVTEDELVEWLTKIGAMSRTASGFRRRTDPPPPPACTVDDAVKGASDARARADAAHVDARNALASSHAFQQALEKWREAMEAMSEVDDREKRALRTRKR